MNSHLSPAFYHLNAAVLLLIILLILWCLHYKDYRSAIIIAVSFSAAWIPSMLMRIFGG